jgi:hypothetical protein
MKNDLVLLALKFHIGASVKKPLGMLLDSLLELFFKT